MCKTTSGYERYRLCGSSFLWMRKGLYGGGGVGRERNLGKDCEGGKVP